MLSRIAPREVSA